jgi:IrrE N-terminal-like domain
MPKRQETSDRLGSGVTDDADADEDDGAMAKVVPYLSGEQIERDAATLLAEYEQAHSVVIEPPIPIEDIVEKLLKLGIEFDDTHRRFGVPRSGLGLQPDILGAIFFDEARIVIDESLDPEEHRSMEGRYRFTLAHEGGGHWRLHRHLFSTSAAQALLFDVPASPSVVCRSSQAKERVERQADIYASCLLMPRKLVFAAWQEVFPDRKPRVIQPRAPISHPFVEIPRAHRQIGDFNHFETDDDALDRAARPLARRFLVSPIAMRIRLVELGLLLREIPGQRILTGDAKPLF